MRRCWIPVKPTPRVGRRVTHVLTMPDPVESKPLAELKINAKIVKPLEAIGIITVHDLAVAPAGVVAGVKQISIKVVNAFRRYCKGRGIPVRMTVSAINKIRFKNKQDAEAAAQDKKNREERKYRKLLRMRNKQKRTSK